MAKIICFRSLFCGIVSGILISFSSCNYLDIVPDNVATLDYAFRMRSQAEKYLFTCYSYIPERGNWSKDPALLGDEVWFFYPYQSAFYGAPPSRWEMDRGNQSTVSPYLNYWDGQRGGKPLFQGIRDCNIFLDNVEKVPDMDALEKKQWISEVLFLKAYYHWYLLRMYGPIPIIDKNKPVSAGVEDVKVTRQPIDSCFNYIVGLIDSATVGLPYDVNDRVSELGRITLPIALSLKARVLINAASPLFNGNDDYAGFVNNKGEEYFNTTYDSEKWKKAADACEEAVNMCESLGYSLYHFQPNVGTYKVGDTLTTQMNIRNAICEKWNSEIIWAHNLPLIKKMQQYAQPILDPEGDVSSGTSRPYGEYAPTLRVAEQFYTSNGLPIDEDKTWDYNGRYDIDTATAADKFYIKPDYVTAKLNFSREPRFYADLGFDGGIWYGQGKYDQKDLWHVEGKIGEFSGRKRGSEYSITGYYCKKIVNFLNVLQNNGKYEVEAYPFPFMRLADLYLYYAEALNEVEGPTSEALKWINKVRDRAGIPTVEDSWTKYSKDPSKYQSKEGLRKIIHRERLNEMAFEGNRFWDLRRWKEAEEIIANPIQGWSVDQSSSEGYYQLKTLYNKTFLQRDYFWPIKEHDIIVNHELIQNPGW